MRSVLLVGLLACSAPPHTTAPPPAKPTQEPAPLILDSPAALPATADKLQGPELDTMMADAIAAYDKMDLEAARTLAQRVLHHQPANTRMLRIMTSSYCLEGAGADAQKWFALLPVTDRDQMKVRCARFGVTFTDPPAD